MKVNPIFASLTLCFTLMAGCGSSPAQPNASASNSSEGSQSQSSSALKLHPVLTLCGKTQSQCAPILGKSSQGTFTWIYQGVKRSRPETHYQVGGCREVTVEFGPGPNTPDFDGLFACRATFPKTMATWQEAFKFLGLSTDGVIQGVEGEIATNMVEPDGKPSKRLAFKHVKGLDKRYILLLDLSGKECKLELDYAVDSGFSTIKMWAWFWDK